MYTNWKMTTLAYSLSLMAQPRRPLSLVFGGERGSTTGGVLMFRKFVVVVLCATALSRVGTAQEPSDCEWLLRYGIYDTQEVAIDRYTVEHLRFLLSRTNAGSVDEFQKEAGAAGLNVFGLFGLNVGGQNAMENFRAWRDAFLNTSTYDLLQDERLRITVKQISPVLMEAVKKCLDRPRPGTLVGWVRPSKDDITFTLNLKYTPLGKEDAVIKTVTVLSSPAGNISPLGEEQEKLIKDGTAVSTIGDGGAKLTEFDFSYIAIEPLK